MLITEIISGLKVFVAQVRVNGTTIKTAVHAENMVYARTLFVGMFGQNSVVSIQQVSESTNETIKPETPAQARVKSLGDQASALKKQEKVARAQIGLKNAQARMAKANLPNNP